VLFTETATQTNWSSGDIVVAPLAGGPSKVVVRGGYYGRYVPGSGGGLGRRSLGEGGHILYMQQGTLFAVRFDLDRLEPVGQAVPAIENVAANPVITGGAQFSLSDEGTLVYVPGTATTTASPIDWIGRDGKIAPLRAAKSNWENPAFSPDGQKLAVEINDGKQTDIWVYEWTRDTFTQLTFDPGLDVAPIWTPDGKRIAFASDRAKPGTLNVYWVNADGTGDVARLTDNPGYQVPSSWHPGGRFLAFTAVANPDVSPQTDLMILPMEGDTARGWTPGQAFAFLSTPANEVGPMFSPDGRWIAYHLANSAWIAGADADVYVRPFPGPGGQWRISASGGLWPTWSTATSDILFLELSLRPKLMAARYSVVGDSFRAGAPQVWSPSAVQGVSPLNHAYALHPDGKRAAAMTAEPGAGNLDKVVFVSHFAEHLRTIAPGRK
jgi:serine/threonine-protein kinase